MKLLDGEIAEDFDHDEQFAELQAELRETRTELLRAKAEATQARQDATRALSALRRQLSPLYRALQQVFGELDATGVDDASAVTGAASSGGDARLNAIWASWKERLGPTCAKVIDALRLQPEMTNRQIAVAIGTGRIQTIYDAVAKMNKVSLLTKNGDRYSLKQL